MRIINSIRSYILEEEFKITIVHNKIDILNFTSIGTIDSNKVVIKYKNGIITIKGTDLVVSRLMNEELLISGNIKSLEFR